MFSPTPLAGTYAIDNWYMILWFLWMVNGGDGLSRGQRGSGPSHRGRWATRRRGTSRTRVDPTGGRRTSADAIEEPSARRGWHEPHHPHAHPHRAGPRRADSGAVRRAKVAGATATRATTDEVVLLVGATAARHLARRCRGPIRDHEASWKTSRRCSTTWRTSRALIATPMKIGVRSRKARSRASSAVSTPSKFWTLRRTVPDVVTAKGSSKDVVCFGRTFLFFFVGLTVDTAPRTDTICKPTS